MPVDVEKRMGVFQANTDLDKILDVADALDYRPPNWSMAWHYLVDKGIYEISLARVNGATYRAEGKSFGDACAKLLAKFASHRQQLGMID